MDKNPGDRFCLSSLGNLFHIFFILSGSLPVKRDFKGPQTDRQTPLVHDKEAGGAYTQNTHMSYIDIKTFRNTPNISDFKVGVNRQKAGIFLVFVVFDCNLKMASVSFQMRSHLLH